MQYLTFNHVVKLVPKRKKDSHKGDNGRVLIVGGSKDYYGAPILAAMAALNSGADLVYLVVPECNFEVSRLFLPDFIVKSYSGEYLNKSALKVIFDLAGKCDCVVLGPGLSDKRSSLKIVRKIIEKISKPLVLDADGLKGFVAGSLDREIVITPHLKEFENLVGEKVTSINKEELATKFAQDKNVTVLLKGPIDFIYSGKGSFAYNNTGNCGMTVGGTGDVLSGVLGSFIAQGVLPFDAAKLAAYICGKAGDELLEEKSYCFTASDLVAMLPYVIKKLY